jgi:cytochrome P450
MTGREEASKTEGVRVTIDLDAVDFALDEMRGERLHETLHAFRAQGPVQTAKFLGLPSYVITGYEALLEAFTDNERFPGHRMYQASLEPAAGQSFISMPEPERHRIYRKLATPAFRSRAVANYEREGMAALANELIDDFAGAAEVDLVRSYAARFPYLVITRLLGLPRDREAEFHAWALALLSFRDDPVKARNAAGELTRFLAPVVEARRAAPEDDVISELVQAEVEGRKLTDEEIYSHVRLLFPTGGETTHGSLGNFFYTLLTEPGLQERLRAEPECIPHAIDELLRWETPIAVLPRMSASEPIDFRGTPMPPDSWVLFAIAGANRDPTIFSEPDRYDIDRREKETLTFGRGAKSCPGMHLAKKNMLVAAQVLFERTRHLELLDPESALPRRTVLRCPDAVRVRVHW